MGKISSSCNVAYSTLRANRLVEHLMDIAPGKFLSAAPSLTFEEIDLEFKYDRRD
jgi:hypothetical protein